MKFSRYFKNLLGRKTHQTPIPLFFSSSAEEEEVAAAMRQMLWVGGMCIGEVDPQGVFLPSGPPPMRLK